MNRASEEPCIVLHSRPYRENSRILSLFSLHEGRLGVVARGLRSGRRGRLLQPFTVLRAGWVGRTGLATLTTFEAEAQFWPQGDALAASFYLAELVTRLLGEREAHPRLYAGLRWALEHVQEDVEPVLRSFEKLLLEEMGYGIDFERDAATGEPVDTGLRYRFDREGGFTVTPAERGVSGTTLLAVARNDYSAAATRRYAKQVFREALSSHLGPRPLASRALLSRRAAPR